MEIIKVAVLTISDSCTHGDREDVSGQTIVDLLADEIYGVATKEIVADDIDSIADKFKEYADKLCVDLVISTGGTGLGPRDNTPEATIAACQKMVPGLGELARAKGYQKTPNAMLSRSVAGIRNNTLIVNLPGSPKAVKESLEVLLSVLPHAVKMMRGGGH